MKQIYSSSRIDQDSSASQPNNESIFVSRPLIEEREDCESLSSSALNIDENEIEYISSNSPFQGRCDATKSTMSTAVDTPSMCYSRRVSIYSSANSLKVRSAATHPNSSSISNKENFDVCPMERSSWVVGTGKVLPVRIPPSSLEEAKEIMVEPS